MRRFTYDRISKLWLGYCFTGQVFFLLRHACTAVNPGEEAIMDYILSEKHHKIKDNSMNPNLIQSRKKERKCRMHNGRALSLSHSWRKKHPMGLKITPLSTDLSLSHTAVYKASVMLSGLKSPFCLEFVLWLDLHLFPHSPLQLLYGCLLPRKQRKALADRRALLFWLDKIAICHVLAMQ